MPDPATAGQLQAMALSVCVFFLSFGTVPCCIRLVLLLMRPTKQCHIAVVKVNSSAKQYELNASCNSFYNNKQHIVLESVLDL